MGSKKLLDMVENWVGKDISGHPVWNIRSKTPQTARMTVPWHQDSAYLKDGAEKIISTQEMGNAVIEELKILSGN